MKEKMLAIIESFKYKNPSVEDNERIKWKYKRDINALTFIQKILFIVFLINIIFKFNVIIKIVDNIKHNDINTSKYTVISNKTLVEIRNILKEKL